MPEDSTALTIHRRHHPAAEPPCDRAAFAAPPASLRAKFFWWWPGAAVEDDELRAEVAEMAQAGFGGARIVVLLYRGLPPYGNPPETYLWGTDHWADRVRVALDAARESGIEMAFTMSPAWPWVSPAVSGANADLSSQQLDVGRISVSGPSAFVGRVPDAEALNSDSGRLIAVTAARAADDRAIRPYAPIDADSVVDLTGGLGEDGMLRWEVPPGEWTIFGFWQRRTGQTVRNAETASPTEGQPRSLVVDHFRRASAEAALAFLDDSLFSGLGHSSDVVADVYEDSLEVVATTMLWTGGFLDEFQSRRGYDLTPYLPVLHIPSQHILQSYRASWHPTPVYGMADGAHDRIRRDYYRTLTELYVEGHIVPTREWANRRGFAFRAEPFGTINVDFIALSKELDIPEAEDLFGGPTFEGTHKLDLIRHIASGAHVSGANKVSMELGVSANADYMITLAELKRRGDKSFVGGVNELVVHGYPYKDAAGAAWPGWQPFSSEHPPHGPWIAFSDGWMPNNPLWRHLRPLADYFGRAQTVLQTGRPQFDVAVYREIYGYRPLPPEVYGPEAELNESLESRGYTFTFVNPDVITAESTHVRDGRLVVQDPGHRALVVDLAASHRLGWLQATDAIPGAVAQRMVELAQQGVPVIFVGAFPARGISYCNPADEDAAVRDAVETLKTLPNVRLVGSESDVPDALESLGVRPSLAFGEAAAASGVIGVHRTSPEADYWFLWNSGETAVNFSASFEVPGRTPELWDLWTGEVRPLGCYSIEGGRVQLPIELGPLETVVIGFETEPALHVVHAGPDSVVVRDDHLYLRSVRSAATAKTQLSDGRTRQVEVPLLPQPLQLAEWTLRVEGAVPAGDERHELTLSELSDWRTVPELEHTSGVGLYSASVVLDEKWLAPGRGVYLELGEVHGGVHVTVNGEPVHPACVPLARFDVSELTRAGENVVEIELTTTLKNRLTELSSHHPDYHRFAFRTQYEKTQPYGLLGPVIMRAYAEVEIA